MYSPDDIQQQRARHAEGRARTGQILANIQQDRDRVRELEQRGDDEPLTALERLELSTRYATLGTALQRTRDTWASARSPLAAAYEQLVIGYYAAADLHEALATIAPGVAGDDPLSGR